MEEHEFDTIEHTTVQGIDTFPLKDKLAELDAAGWGIISVQRLRKTEADENTPLVGYVYEIVVVRHVPTP